MSILIAGIGNIFFGDDAFGCKVVAEMARRDCPDGVVIKDFGIRGFDLAYTLTDGFSAAILVDAVSRRGTPGTLYLIEPDIAALRESPGFSFNAHTLDPVAVLQMAHSFGILPGKIYLLGCEPATLDAADGELALSPAVRAAVPDAVSMIESLVVELLKTKPEPETAGLPAA